MNSKEAVCILSIGGVKTVPGIEWFKEASDMHKSVVIAIVIAAIFFSYLLFFVSTEEHYTSLYLYPESYTNYPDDSTVSFLYGIQSFEKERAQYTVNIYVDRTRKESKMYELDPGDVFEEEISLDIIGVNLPARVRVELVSPFNRYETYFWIKDTEGRNTPLL